MPEFILDHGSPDAARQFRMCDSFTQGYLQALFFTDCEHGTVREAEDDFSRVWDPENDSVLPGDVTLSDLSDQAWCKVIKDCRDFQDANAALLDAARELVPGGAGFKYGRNDLDDRRLGQLFWYARNGHGVAFTDDGDAPCLHALQDACGWQTAFPEVNSYLGDDGLIYLD